MPDHQELQSEVLQKIDTNQKGPDESHLRFGQLGESIIRSLETGVVAFGPDLKIVQANPQAAKLIEMGDYIDKSLAKGTRAGAATVEGTDEEICGDWTRRLNSAIATGKTRKFENVSYTLNGRTKMLRIVCTPLGKSGRGRPTGGTVIIEDVTEKANLQKQLADAERLAAAGKLASKVAHELNNPMDGILRYINLTIRSLEQENLEKPRDYLIQCRQGLMRMVQIVSELLEFSRGTYMSFECVRIERIIEDAIKAMSSSTEASNVQILSNYAPDIPQIRAGNLFQVFCNLVKNALDAMPDGGKLSISTQLVSDDTVVVQFRDTGAGFAVEDAEAIFEPFFTTKSKGKGTGLGLAICKDIIERYHGRITAENAPGGGSIFTIYLPVVSENP
jgi:signal transduction histidine kinase